MSGSSGNGTDPGTGTGTGGVGSGGGPGIPGGGTPVFRVLADFSPATGTFSGAGLTFGPDGTLYGTTQFDGANGSGSVFSLTGADHATLTVLHSFNFADGLNPLGVWFSTGTDALYGITIRGGALQYGTAFVLTGADHTDFATLVDHGANGDGVAPLAGFTLDAAGNLFGTNWGGGDGGDGAGYGTIYELLGPDHATLSTVHSFTGGDDGFRPASQFVVDAAGRFYGTTSGDAGTIFELSGADRATFTTLHHFSGADGFSAQGPLSIDAAGTIYGVTAGGGGGGQGTVWAFSADHTLTTLHSFNGADGAAPQAGVVADSAGNLFGVTTSGGEFGNGVIFELSGADHTTFTLLHSFTTADGTAPLAAWLTLDSAGNLYGTTTAGGAHGGGTVFELSAPGPVIPPTPATVTLGETGGTAGLTRIISHHLLGQSTGLATGSLVTILDQATGQVAGTTTTQADGSYAVDASLLGQGAHSLVARVTDASGHAVLSAARVYTLDTVAPGVTLAPAASLAGAAPLQLQGTAEAGSTVQIFDGGTAIGATVIAGPSGGWSLSLSPTPGFHALTAHATDAAGNVGISGMDAVTQVAITSAGGHFKNPPQVVSGTGEAGSTIQLYDNGVKLGAALVVDATGTWSTSIRLAAGTNSLTVRDTPLVGEAVTSAAVLYVLDKQPPVVTLASSGGLTNQAAQTVSGTGEAGTSVQLYDGTRAIGSTVTVGADGTWIAGFSLAKQGDHAITARDTDSAGNFGVSDAVVFSYDSVAPAIAITSGGGLTRLAAPVVSGTGEAGTRVQLYDGGVASGASVVVDATGHWTATAALATQGAHSITARDTDAAGNVGTSAALGFSLDTVAPTVTLTNIGKATNQLSQTFTGTGEAFTDVEVLDGTTVIGSATVNRQGKWTAAFVKFLPGDGTHVISARDTDAAGNVGISSTTTYTLDTTGPALAITSVGRTTNQASQVVTGTIGRADAGAVVTILDNGVAIGSTTSLADGSWSATVRLTAQGSNLVSASARDAAGNIGGSDQIGFVLDSIVPVVAITSPGGLTRLLAPRMSGTGEAGSTVQLYDGAVASGASVRVDSTGHWTATAALAATQGLHRITARDTDGGGNVGTSDVLNLVLDTVAPAVTLNPSGKLTNQAQQTFSGTGERFTSIELLDGGTVIGTTTVNSQGKWSAAFIRLVPGDGTHVITARDTDDAGNMGTSSATTFTLDTTGPALAITSGGQASNQANRVVSGTIGLADAGALVTIDEGGVAIGSTRSLADGSWSATVRLAGEGDHPLVARATDALGNTGFSASTTYVLDTTAPTVAFSSTGAATSVTSPLLAGTVGNGTVGAIVTLRDTRAGNAVVGTGVLDATGHWRATAQLAGDGLHSLVASTTDAAGNVGSSAALAITLDTVAPTMTMTTVGKVTNQLQQTFSGTGERGTNIILLDGGIVIASAIVGTNGRWSTSPNLLPGDGAHVITVRDMDAAGNVSPSIVTTFTLDTLAPVVAISTASNLTLSPSLTLNGTGEAGTTVQLFDGATALASVKVDATGHWAKAITLVGTGLHSLVAKDTDLAGNVGTSTAVVMDYETSQVGITSAGGLTNKAAHVVAGYGKAGTTVQLLDGVEIIGSTTVDATGHWRANITLAGDPYHEGYRAHFVVPVDVIGTQYIPGIALQYQLDPLATVLRFTSASGATNQRDQLLTGTARPEDVGRHVMIGDTATGSQRTAIVQADGSWSLLHAFGADRAYTLTATMVDAIDNTWGATETIILDTVAPQIRGLTVLQESGAATNFLVRGALTPGAVDAGSSVQLFELVGQDYILVGSTIADGSGFWSVRGHIGGTGSHTFLAGVTDLAGNQSSATGSGNFYFPNDNPAAGPVFIVDQEVLDFKAQKVHVSGKLYTHPETSVDIAGHHITNFSVDENTPYSPRSLVSSITIDFDIGSGMAVIPQDSNGVWGDGKFYRGEFQINNSAARVYEYFVDSGTPSHTNLNYSPYRPVLVQGVADANIFVQLMVDGRATGLPIPTSEQFNRWSEYVPMVPGPHTVYIREISSEAGSFFGAVHNSPSVIFDYEPATRKAGWWKTSETLVFPGLNVLDERGLPLAEDPVAFDFSTGNAAGVSPRFTDIRFGLMGMNQGAHAVVTFDRQLNHTTTRDVTAADVFGEIGRFLDSTNHTELDLTVADPRFLYLGTTFVDVVEPYQPDIFLDTVAHSTSSRSLVISGHVTMPVATPTDLGNERLKAVLQSDITLYDKYDSAVLGRAALDSSGHWEARVTFLDDGAHEILAHIANPVGDTANSETVLITLTAPHAAPAIRGDFTGEGHADILLVGSNGALVLVEPTQTAAQANTPLLSFNTGFLKPASLTYGAFGLDGIGDFDGDGRADLLVHQAVDARFQYEVLLSNPVSADHSVDLADQIAANNPVGSWAVLRQVLGVADFNGDGFSDVVLRGNDGSGNLQLWLMAGLRQPVVVDVAATATTSGFAGVGDFNGDGMADILWYDGTGTLSLWKFNNAIAPDGSQTMALDVIQTVSAAAPAGWSIRGIGDFDGNGRSDIVWTAPDVSHAGQTDVLIWLMDGPTRTSQAVVGFSPAGGYDQLAAVGDYDGDGHADLQFRDASGNLTVWYMNGLSVSHLAIVAPTQTVADLLTIA